MQKCPKCSTWSPDNYSNCAKCDLDFTVPFTPPNNLFKMMLIFFGICLISFACVYGFNNFWPRRYEKPTVGMTYQNFVQVCPFKAARSNSVESLNGSKLTVLIEYNEQTAVNGCYGGYVFENGYLIVIEKN